MSEFALPTSGADTERFMEASRRQRVQILFQLSIPPAKALDSYLYHRDRPTVAFADSRGVKAREALASAVEKDGFTHLEHFKITTEEEGVAPFLASMVVDLDRKGCNGGATEEPLAPLYVLHALSAMAHQANIVELHPDWEIAPGFGLRIRSEMTTPRTLSLSLLLTLSK